MEKYARRVRYVTRAAEHYHARVLRSAERYRVRALPKRYHIRITRTTVPLQYPNRQYIRPHAGQKGVFHLLRILRSATSDPGKQVAPGAPGELLSG